MEISEPAIVPPSETARPSSLREEAPPKGHGGSDGRPSRKALEWHVDNGVQTYPWAALKVGQVHLLLDREGVRIRFERITEELIRVELSQNVRDPETGRWSPKVVASGQLAPEEDVDKGPELTFWATQFSDRLAQMAARLTARIITLDPRKTMMG